MRQKVTKEPGLSMVVCYQSECILDILEESSQKLHIVFLLVEAIKNPELICDFFQTLSEEEKFECFQVLAEIKQNESFFEAYCVNKVDYRFVKLVNLLYHCSPNCQVVAKLVTAKDLQLILAFTDLAQTTEERLKKSPVMEMNKEKMIHHMKHDLDNLQKSLKTHHQLLKSKKITHRWQLAIQAVLVQKYEEDLAIKKWDNNVRIKQEIVKSSRMIHEIHSGSLVRQNELRLELEDFMQRYQQTYANNLQLESQFKAEKNALILELQTLIRRYDQTIGDKTVESMNLKEKYEEKKSRFDEFMLEFRSEEIEYIELVKEKESEEERRHQEKVMMFMMNRAARNVQRYWRKYRRDMKKKSKKKKTKKKS